MVLKIQENNDNSIKNIKKNKSSNIRVHFILDESGSMSCCHQATIDGFNEYVNDLKQDKNKNKYWISLTTFEGGNIKKIFEDVSIKKVKKLTKKDYSPCGMTNLNDAIGFTITEMQKNNKVFKKHNTLVIIMTDGYENASKEWNSVMVSNLIKEQEKKGWTITFLGANINTHEVSNTYSIDPSNAKSYSTNNMRGTMMGLSQATQIYATSAIVGSSATDFFKGTDSFVKTDSDDNERS